MPRGYKLALLYQRNALKKKNKATKKTKVIVRKVEANWVGVHWQCRAYSNDGKWDEEQIQPKFFEENDN